MSNIDAFKDYITIYIAHFTIYDYVAYAWLVLLFFITILLSIFTAKKSALLSILIFFFSLIILFVGPFILKHYLDNYLRPVQNKVILIKKLNFSDALVVTAEITNTSKNSYSICNSELNIFKKDDSTIKNFIYQLKPLRKKTISLDEALDVNATKEIRVVFDNYTYNKDINVSINSECY